MISKIWNDILGMDKKMRQKKALLIAQEGLYIF